MISKIEWKKEEQCQARGYNGVMRCLGLEVSSDSLGDTITLMAINTKGVSDALYIEMPKFQVRELVRALTMHANAKPVTTSDGRPIRVVIEGEDINNKTSDSSQEGESYGMDVDE